MKSNIGVKIDEFLTDLIMTIIVFCGGMRFIPSAYADEQGNLAERRM